jgi:hypothetical protein
MICFLAYDEIKADFDFYILVETFVLLSYVMV